MTKVEIDEVFGLMSDIASEVAANYAVPGRSLSLIKLFCGLICFTAANSSCAYSPLDVLGNVLLNAEFAHCILSCSFVVSIKLKNQA